MQNVAAPKLRTLASQAEISDLARVVAEHHGWQTDGGWIFADGTPLAQGYITLANKLERLGVIVEGRGIDWTRMRNTTISAIASTRPEPLR